MIKISIDVIDKLVSRRLDFQSPAARIWQALQVLQEEIGKEAEILMTITLHESTTIREGDEPHGQYTI